MSKSSSNRTKILISPDKSRVELLISSSDEGQKPSLDDCLGQLYKAELKVEQELIGEITDAIEELDGEARILVGEGKSPVHGVDGGIEWFVDDDSESADSPEDEAGDADSEEGEAVDHYSRCAFIMVTTDQELGRVVAPTDGEDGVDAWGQAISAKPGKSVTIRHDDSIITNASGVMIAQSDGVLSRSREKVCVRKYLEINEYVDFSTGHIDFDGDVAIEKGVRDNFNVKATGNIEIGQLIEQASIEAGGSIFARGGMAGRGEGIARTGGDLTIKYFDGCSVHVGGNLMIEREMIDCDVFVSGAVHSPAASVIGGKLTAIGAVELSTVGSGSATETTIRLGSVPALEQKLAQLVELEEKLESKREKTQQELDQLSTRGKNLTPTEAERQTELMFEISPIAAQLEKCTASITQLREKIEAVSTVHLTVARAIHPGAVIEVGDARYMLQDKVSGPLTVLRSRQGEVVYRIGDSGSNLPIKQISDFRLAA